MRRYFPNQNLFYLWIGQLISLSGDYLYQIGLFWWVLEYSGSTVQAGLVGACFFLPTLFFGLYGGVVADRLGYRRVMLWADGIRLVLVLFVALTFAIGWISTPLLMAVAFLVATGGAFFNPAKDALIPELARGANLIQINAVQQSSWPFSLLVGALVAAATIGHPAILFTLNALSFLVSLVCVLKIRHRWATAGREGEAASPARASKLWVDMKAGLAQARSDPRVLWLLVLTAIDNLFIMGPALVGLTIFVKQHLQLPGTYYARMESAYGFGMLLSMYLIHRFADRLPKGKLLLVGIFLDGLTYVPMYWSHTFASTYVIFFIHSWAIPMIMVGRASLIQTVVPEGIRGRVFSLSNIMVVGMTALSNALTGWLADFIPIHLLFALIGAGGALCGAIGWLYRPLRQCE